MHGGNNVGVPGNQHARKHGIYARYLDPEEKAILDEIKIGDVSDEIEFVKAMAVRAARLFANPKEIKDGLPGDNDLILHDRKQQALNMANVFLKRAKEFEALQRDLLAGKSGDPDDVAMKITESLKEMEEVDDNL